MMKKLALAVLALTAFLSLRAQDYSTSWPYLYPEFREGTIYMNDGTKLVYNVNVHILHGRLHYLDKGVVKEAISSNLLLIKIGDDEYMNVNGDIMKIVAKNDKGMVTALQLGDFERLRDAGGAYGSSTTSSATRRLTSVDVAGKVNQNHMELWESRHNGELVDLVTTYYIVTPTKTVEATQRAIRETLDDAGKDAFKKWLKQNKIKWKNPESLLTLTEFLNQ
jgi:hypothetical protein